MQSIKLMKNGTAHRGNAHPPTPAQAAQPISTMESGILVREEELGSVKAQRLYKMRCDCGRSWFELELPRLVECPACKKLCLVSA
jgi:hypothetical protein